MNSNCNTAVWARFYEFVPGILLESGGGPCGGLLLRGWSVKKGRGGGKREPRYKVVGKVEGKREEKDGERGGKRGKGKWENWRKGRWVGRP